MRNLKALLRHLTPEESAELDMLLSAVVIDDDFEIIDDIDFVVLGA